MPKPVKRQHRMHHPKRLAHPVGPASPVSPPRFHPGPIGRVGPILQSHRRQPEAIPRDDCRRAGDARSTSFVPRPCCVVACVPGGASRAPIGSPARVRRPYAPGPEPHRGPRRDRDRRPRRRAGRPARPGGAALDPGRRRPNANRRAWPGHPNAAHAPLGPRGERGRPRTPSTDARGTT